MIRKQLGIIPHPAVEHERAAVVREQNGYRMAKLTPDGATALMSQTTVYDTV